ncbi:hypothetical protein G6F44_004657 [Rhizopus delemar]|nr:hypothetical protein G6F44_004657 [Rhizopus delemar]
MEESLGLLVSKLTGLEENDPAWARIVDKTKYTIKYSKCNSTSEKEVNDSFKGLADKFIIKGRHEVSKALLQHKNDFLNNPSIIGTLESNQRILKYDLLKLLLCLSSSLSIEPYTSKLEDQQKEPEITWDDIIREDPLDGDHWKSWSEDDNSIEEVSDEDIFEVDQVAAQPKEFNAISNEPEFRFFESMEVDDRGDPEILEHLIAQQYWRSDFSFPEEHPSDHPLLQNPCRLNSALSAAVYHEQDVQSLNFINESDLIREVNRHYTVLHLSQSALFSLLSEFCEYGNMLLDLREIALHILSKDMLYGQTAQAFATAIYKSLLSFEGQLSYLERDANYITKNSAKYVSILKLRNELQIQLQCFHEIHNIAICAPFEENDNPRRIACYLISTLYEHVLTSQISGKNTIYNAILYIFQQTIVPFGRLMDGWMFRGSLEEDRIKEFYVSRNEDVSMNGSKFWTDGFSIETVAQDIVCPLFEKRNMERIFFTGKAVNLLLQIEKIQKEQIYLNEEPIFFSKAMKTFLPIKQPFIDAVGKGPQEESVRKSYDIFTQSLFSMTYPSKQSVHEDVNEARSSIDDDGSLFDQSFIQCIEYYVQAPYMNIAHKLNIVLHKHCGLLVQLKSLASIYLMLENDMMHSFCEAIFIQMDNKEHWFDQRSLNGTFIETCETNGYSETVHIEMERPISTRTMVSIVELVQFKVSIPWPLNNFIQEDCLTRYSIITSFLLRLRRAKYVLEKKMLFKGKVKYEKCDVNSTWLYAVRMRMLWFVNTIWRYIMVTVLHVETIKFRESLSSSTDADEITILHNAYIDRIIDRCMLDEKSTSIKMAIIKIFDMTENLADAFSKYIGIEEQLRSYNNYGIEDLRVEMDTIEKEFNRINEFVSSSLMDLSKKNGLFWCENLAASLNVQ